MLADLFEPRLAQHFFELGKSVSVARDGSRQHDKTEAGRVRWGDAIRVRNEFDNRNAAARPERAVNSLQKTHTGRGIEVMKEIWDEHDIVIFSEIDFESAADDRAETIAEVRGLRVFARHFQDRRPIERDQMRARIFLRERD